MEKKGAIRLFAVLLLGAMLIGTIPAADAAGRFTDVPQDAWYREAVDFVAEQNLMNGTGERRFSPNVKLNRAMFVTVLYRLAGSPPVLEQPSFADVPSGCYYEQAVKWADNMGITCGTSETTFAPMAGLTREQMACMLERYLKKEEGILIAPPAGEPFPDQDQISGYAVESVDYVHALGLLVGDKNGSFRPRGTSTRAETAMVLLRLKQMIEALSSPGRLEVRDPADEGRGESHLLSAEDTAALCKLLLDSAWVQEEYAEYVPTHVLTLGNVRYQFYLPGDGRDYPGFNYIQGNGAVYGGKRDPAGDLMPQIAAVFSRYTESWGSNE